MNGSSSAGERSFLVSARRRLAWAVRIGVRLVLASSILLLLIALLLGVTDVGRSGNMLLGAAAAIVVGYLARLAWPYIVRVARRIRVRFSLRALLVATVVVGIGLAWFGNKLRDVREQRQILDGIFKRDFLVGFDDAMPGWWYERFGWNGVLFWGHVGFVGRDNPLAKTDDDLRALAGLRFSELSFNLSGVTDEQLQRWQPPKELKQFSAQSTGFNDKIAEHVSHWTQLEELKLWGTPLTDEGIAHLACLPKLHTLKLERTAITDDSVEHLKSMKQLRVLSIWQTGISAQGCAELEAALPDCKIHY